MSGFRQYRMHLLSFAGWFVVLAVGSAQAGIRSGVPEGFADMVDPVPRGAVTDTGAAYAELWADGERVGDVIVYHEQERLRFEESQQLTSLIPRLRRAAELVTWLGRPGTVCVGDAAASCEIQPGRLAAVYEPHVPRLSLYLSARFRTPPEPLRPSHAESPGLLSSFSLRGSGRQGADDDSQRASLAVDLVAGRGASSVFGDGVALSTGRFFARRAGVQRYFGRYRWAAGLLQADASDHFAQIDVVGTEWGTTTHTLPAGQRGEDPPLVVFLGEDSQVDVLRGEELLFSRSYPAGAVNIPTRRFPGGSYDITLLIRDASGGTRQENRFFFRPQARLPAGWLSVSLQAGLTRDAHAPSGRFAESRLPYASFQVARSSASGLLLGGRLGTFDDLAFVELLSERQTDTRSVRLSALATARGGYSLAARISGSWAGVTFNSSLRHSDIDRFAAAFRSRTERFTELNVGLSGALPGNAGTLNLHARTRSADHRSDSVAWGLNWSRAVRWFGSRGRISLSWQHSEGERSLQMRLHLGARSARQAISAQFSRNQPFAASAARDAYTSAGLQSTWWSDRRAASPWSLTARAGIDSDERRQIGLDGRRRSDAVDAEGQLRYERGDGDVFSYSGAVHSLLAVSSAGLAWSAERQARGGVVLDTRGVDEQVRLTSAVGGQRRALVPRSVTFQPLTTFHSHRVAFRPERGSSIGYDNSRVNVLPFPGNLVVIQPELFRVVTVFGRLVDAALQPLRGRIVTDAEDAYLTGDDGYFVMDLPLRSSGSALRIEQADSEACYVTLPDLEPGDEAYLDLGDLTCRRAE